MTHEKAVTDPAPARRTLPPPWWRRPRQSPDAATAAAALILILVAAFWLRFHDLGTNPPELLEDELAGAASAWSVATTGRDVERTALPFLPTRLELKQPLYYFTTVPARALLDRDSTLSARLPAVAFGVANTALIVWLMRRLGRPDAEALLAAALFAIVPWAVHNGRVGWEPAAFIAPALLGVGLLWSGLERDRPRVTAAGGIVLAAGAYSYHPALLVNALLAAAVIAVQARRAAERRQLLALGIAAGAGLLLLLPYLNAFANDPLFTMRTKSVSVFKDGVTADAIALAWTNYWQQWSPKWLFLSATPNPRYHPNVPVLFAWLAPFLLLGIVRLLRRQTPADTFLLLWLLLGALPAGITNDGVPHFARGLLALPPILMVTASGLVWSWEGLRRASPWRELRVAAALLFASLLAIEGVRAYRVYYRDMPALIAPAWHYSPATPLRILAETIPDGASVCIDVPDGVSYWTFPHTIAYYLGEPRFTVVEGLKQPQCAQPGAYILMGLHYNPNTDRVPARTRTVASIPRGVAQAPFLIEQVEGP